MKRLAILAALAALAVPVFAGIKGETAEPTTDGYRIRREALQEGLVYIIFAGDGRVEVAQGDLDVGPKLVKFKNRKGQLFSIRLDILDMPATLRANELLREGKWMDPQTEMLSKVKVRALTAEERAQYQRELRAEIAHDVNNLKDAEIAATCGTLSGDARGMCALAAEARVDRKVDEIRLEAARDAARQH